MAIVALAIGIGCATAIFTICNAILIKPLPYSYPDRWVTVFGGNTLASEAERISGMSLADLEQYQHRLSSFEVFGWYFLAGDFNLTSPGQPEHVNGVEVSPALIANSGVRPIVGGLFHDSDGPQVVLISSRLWKRLGSDAAIVGKAVTLNGQAYTVMGVMPGWFQLPVVTVNNVDPHNDVWIPVKTPSDEAGRNVGLYVAYGRLKPGVTIEQARADTKRVAAELVEEHSHDATYTATLFGLKDFVGKEIRPFLFLFLGAAGLLLIITCANVAGLLVAKSVSRAQEIAIRVALGARHRQLAVQFFLEGCFISFAATSFGVLASIGLTRLVVSLAAEYIPRSDEISFDGRVLFFAAVLACLSAFLPSLAPLWQAVHTQPNEVLGGGVRVSANVRSRRIARALVAVEIALAFLLLTVSGLLISELESLRHTWPGFEADHVVTFELNLSGESFPSEKEFVAHDNNLLASIEALPGVESAALTNQLPLDGCCLTNSLYPEGQAPEAHSSHEISFVIVSPYYFRTMQIPLRAGRLLGENDVQEDPVAVVIDEAAARQFWTNRNPIGSFGRIGGTTGTRIQVAGVVGNTRNQGLGDATRPEIYIPNAVAPLGLMDFVVRSELPASSLAPEIRHAIFRADPTHPIYSVRTMNEILQGSLFSQRFASIVVGFFAIASLVMAAFGIFSVTSYFVRERTVEIGTRMAMGAVRGDLFRMVVGDALKMAAYGIPLGAVAAVGATWLVMRFVYLHHISVLAFVYSTIVVGLLTAAASLWPAWRATLLSPMVAIRNEADSLWASGRRSLERRAVRDAETESPVSALLTGFADASRQADTFNEALAMALAELRERVRSDSAMLFERVDGQEPHYDLRAASPDVPVAAIPDGGFLLNRLKFYRAPMAFASGDLDTALKWASEQRPQHVAEIEALKQLGMALAVALRTKQEIIGVLLLGAPLERKTYRRADKELIQACAQELTLMMENARLTDRMVEQEKIRRDVALAAEVQEKLLAQRSMEAGPISIAAFFLPARVVGGDCYDFLNLENKGLAIALADVAGKGVAAALIMAVVQSSLRIVVSDGLLSPHEVAARMNHFLHRSTGSSSYATFFYAELQPEKRQLRYVNAGHNPPYLLRAGNSGTHEGEKACFIEELKTGGSVIGLFAEEKYEEAVVDLRPGDVVLAFTDGVPEALNPQEEEFGEDRLKELLQRVAHQPVQQMVTCISQELRGWIANAPQHDDLTFIVLKTA